MAHRLRVDYLALGSVCLVAVVLLLSPLVRGEVMVPPVPYTAPGIGGVLAEGDNAGIGSVLHTFSEAMAILEPLMPTPTGVGKPTQETFKNFFFLLSQISARACRSKGYENPPDTTGAVFDEDNFFEDMTKEEGAKRGVYLPMKDGTDGDENIFSVQFTKIATVAVNSMVVSSKGFVEGSVDIEFKLFNDAPDASGAAVYPTENNVHGGPVLTIPDLGTKKGSNTIFQVASPGLKMHAANPSDGFNLQLSTDAVVALKYFFEQDVTKKPLNDADGENYGIRYFLPASDIYTPGGTYHMTFEEESSKISSIIVRYTPATVDGLAIAFWNKINADMDEAKAKKFLGSQNAIGADDVKNNPFLRVPNATYGGSNAEFLIASYSNYCKVASALAQTVVVQLGISQLVSRFNLQDQQIGIPFNRNGYATGALGVLSIAGNGEPSTADAATGSLLAGVMTDSNTSTSSYVAGKLPDDAIVPGTNRVLNLMTYSQFEKYDADPTKSSGTAALYNESIDTVWKIFQTEGTPPVANIPEDTPNDPVGQVIPVYDIYRGHLGNTAAVEFVIQTGGRATGITMTYQSRVEGSVPDMLSWAAMQAPPKGTGVMTTAPANPLTYNKLLVWSHLMYHMIAVYQPIYSDGTNISLDEIPGNGTEKILITKTDEGVNVSFRDPATNTEYVTSGSNATIKGLYRLQCAPSAGVDEAVKSIFDGLNRFTSLESSYTMTFSEKSETASATFKSSDGASSLTLKFNEAASLAFLPSAFWASGVSYQTKFCKTVETCNGYGDFLWNPEKANNIARVPWLMGELLSLLGASGGIELGKAYYVMLATKGENAVTINAKFSDAANSGSYESSIGTLMTFKERPAGGGSRNLVATFEFYKSYVLGSADASNTAAASLLIKKGVAITKEDGVMQFLDIQRMGVDVSNLPQTGLTKLPVNAPAITINGAIANDVLKGSQMTVAFGDGKATVTITLATDDPSMTEMYINSYIVGCKIQGQLANRNLENGLADYDVLGNTCYSMGVAMALGTAVDYHGTTKAGGAFFEIGTIGKSEQPLEPTEAGYVLTTTMTGVEIKKGAYSSQMTSMLDTAGETEDSKTNHYFANQFSGADVASHLPNWKGAPTVANNLFDEMFKSLPLLPDSFEGFFTDKYRSNYNVTVTVGRDAVSVEYPSALGWGQLATNLRLQYFIHKTGTETIAFFEKNPEKPTYRFQNVACGFEIIGRLAAAFIYNGPNVNQAKIPKTIVTATPGNAIEHDGGLSMATTSLPTGTETAVVVDFAPISEGSSSPLSNGLYVSAANTAAYMSAGYPGTDFAEVISSLNLALISLADQSDLQKALDYKTTFGFSKLPTVINGERVMSSLEDPLLMSTMASVDSVVFTGNKLQFSLKEYRKDPFLGDTRTAFGIASNAPAATLHPNFVTEGKLSRIVGGITYAINRVVSASLLYSSIIPESGVFIPFDDFGKTTDQKKTGAGLLVTVALKADGVLITDKVVTLKKTTADEAGEAINTETNPNLAITHLVSELLNPVKLGVTEPSRTAQYTTDEFNSYFENWITGSTFTNQDSITSDSYIQCLETKNPAATAGNAVVIIKVDQNNTITGSFTSTAMSPAVEAAVQQLSECTGKQPAEIIYGGDKNDIVGLYGLLLSLAAIGSTSNLNKEMTQSGQQISLTDVQSEYIIVPNDIGNVAATHSESIAEEDKTASVFTSSDIQWVSGANVGLTSYKAKLTQAEPREAIDASITSEGSADLRFLTDIISVGPKSTVRSAGKISFDGVSNLVKWDVATKLPIAYESDTFKKTTNKILPRLLSDSINDYWRVHGEIDVEKTQTEFTVNIKKYYNVTAAHSFPEITRSSQYAMSSLRAVDERYSAISDKGSMVLAIVAFFADRSRAAAIRENKNTLVADISNYAESNFGWTPDKASNPEATARLQIAKKTVTSADYYFMSSASTTEDIPVEEAAVGSVFSSGTYFFKSDSKIPENVWTAATKYITSFALYDDNKMSKTGPFSFQDQDSLKSSIFQLSSKYGFGVKAGPTVTPVVPPDEEENGGGGDGGNGGAESSAVGTSAPTMLTMMIGTVIGGLFFTL